MNLTMKNVCYAYKNNASHQVLNNINYDFEIGKVYAICGPSGSGKTTILSLLAGLDTPQSGQIYLNNIDIKQQGYRTHRKDNITIIFQNYNLIDYMTPIENLRLVQKNAPGSLLIELGIEPKDFKRNVLQLSGGQQQRVAIARSLASPAPFILADEPTGNLDEENATVILDIFKKLANTQNKGIIIVTHSKSVAKLADVTLALSKNGLKVLNKSK
ncbi:ATP-binding cassette domain-containing protein [Erysipelothrix rhusiopathiae]|nr:ATP-binding cassette domain-containing protein [Erysipelothrix rhusiopathiae]